MVSLVYRLVLATTLLTVATALPAGAALFAPPALLAPSGDPGAGAPVDHDITGLAIDLTLDATHPTAETTHLAYDVALGDDASATVWAIVGFSVIRGWSEGAVVGAVESPDGWDGVVAAHFGDWAAAGPGIGEGDHLGGFGYTVARSSAPSQLYVYFVTKDGGDAFPVLSSDLPVLAGSEVTVPEPASAALLLTAIGPLFLRRRG